jgi:ribosomal protein S18 acetylase RimI-like enzyme
MSSTIESLPIRIRKATEADVAFIFNSWLKSFRDSAFARSITDTIYFNEHHRVIEELLKNCEVFIACDEKDVSQIYGYICAEYIEGIFCVHYVYVKHTYRNLGIAKKLASQYNYNPDVATLISHCTSTASKLTEKFKLVHSPYVALSHIYRKASK